MIPSLIGLYYFFSINMKPTSCNTWQLFFFTKLSKIIPITITNLSIVSKTSCGRFAKCTFPQWEPSNSLASLLICLVLLVHNSILIDTTTNNYGELAMRQRIVSSLAYT